MLRRAAYEIIEPGVKAGPASALFKRCSVAIILLSVAAVVASTMPSLGDAARANLSQLRVIDTRRLERKIGFLEKGVFAQIRKAARELL